jgi:hypothetical protein
MRLPTFFVLGAPKCGTTALAQTLGAHPEVFLSRPKEPHFFDAHYDIGLEAYAARHFAGAAPDAVLGEATPSYLAVPYVAERIRRDIPAARLIVILRDPIQRAWSSWWMLHARGMEPLSFVQAIAANVAALSGSGTAQGEVSETQWKEQVARIEAGEPLRIRNYLDGGYYAQHLRRYLELFPREQLFVAFSHQLQQHPRNTVQALQRHIGLKNSAREASTAVANEAVGSDSRVLLSMARSLGLMRVRSLLPEGARHWIKKGLSALGRPPTLEPEVRRQLLTHFEPHIAELERLLDVDLRAWRAYRASVQRPNEPIAATETATL